MTRKETLGEQLRTARLEKGLSLRDAAPKIGIHYVYLGEIERNEKTPSLDTLTSLAKFYGLSLDGLLGLS